MIVLTKVNITYLDANKLYCWARVTIYHIVDLNGWVKTKLVTFVCFYDFSSIDYILEVDLEYPSEFHDLHNDYPLAPEKLEIRQNMLSKYCFNIANEYGIKIGGVNKLVPNLSNKIKYVVHYRNLQL